MRLAGGPCESATTVSPPFHFHPIVFLTMALSYSAQWDALLGEGAPSEVDRRTPCPKPSLQASAGQPLWWQAEQMCGWGGQAFESTFVPMPAALAAAAYPPAVAQ